MRQIVHAGLIALFNRGFWIGALIEGSSGVGKSDLALRALDHGFRLVADDRTQIWVCQGRLYGASPASIHGLMEVRGMGVLTCPALPFAEIRLIADCHPVDAALERMPEPGARQLAGVATPVTALRPLEASAPLKLHRMLSLLGASS